MLAINRFPTATATVTTSTADPTVTAGPTTTTGITTCTTTAKTSICYEATTPGTSVAPSNVGVTGTNDHVTGSGNPMTIVEDGGKMTKEEAIEYKAKQLLKADKEDSERYINEQLETFKWTLKQALANKCASVPKSKREGLYVTGKKSGKYETKYKTIPFTIEGSIHYINGKIGLPMVGAFPKYPDLKDYIKIVKANPLAFGIED